jgi:plasmid stabilization system protein ParE
MERQIVWNKGALKQLEVIYEYIKNDSSQNAEKVIEKIRIRINDLPIHPKYIRRTGLKQIIKEGITGPLLFIILEYLITLKGIK